MPRTFATRNIDEAIVQTLAFRKELEDNDYQRKVESTQEKIEVEKPKPRLMVEAMAYYIEHLENVRVSKAKQKIRSKSHKDGVQRTFRYFCEAIIPHGYRHTAILVDQIDDKMLDHFYDYILEENDYANGSYNKYMSIMRQWVSWLNEEGYSIKNPFQGVTRRPEDGKEQLSMSKKEFEELLKVITPENGIQQLRTCKKRHYQPWMASSFKLALFTGLRREEIFQIKFNMLIYSEENEPLCFQVPNFKVQRSKGVATNEGVQMKMVPMTSELIRVLLEDFSFERYRNTDNYVIAPESNMMRKTMWEKCSKAFAHYAKQIKSRNDYNLNDLRNTFLTKLLVTYGNDAKVISDHSTSEILKKHYTDKKILSEVMKNFSVFEEK